MFSLRLGKDLFAAVPSVVNTGARQGLTAYQAICKTLYPNSSLFSLVESLPKIYKRFR